jgi:hypothetical protein
MQRREKTFLGKSRLPSAEEQLIRSFFTRGRERYLSGLASARKRRKLTNEFCHFKNLDPRFVVSIEPCRQNPSDIYLLLKQYGAPERCWAVSDDSSLDQRIINLDDALEEIVGSTFATFLCCLDGKLAYFENEDGRCILHRP